MGTDQEKQLKIIVDSKLVGERIDKVLGQQQDIPSRSFAEKAIAEGLVTVNGTSIKPSYRLAEGDEVTIVIPAPKRVSIEPEAIPLDIVYEDQDLVVINKRRGMVVHPAAGHYRETLVNALLYHCGDLSGIGGKIRPGIVHRLDMDTTGLLVVAKNDQTHLKLATALKKREIHRWYLALIHNRPKATEGLIDAPIGRHPVHRKKMAITEKGRSAVTRYRVINSGSQYSVLELKLETGRTHQIRVHLAYIGTPVAGDQVYGKGRELGLAGQALHAFKLKFSHPRTGQDLELVAPPPDDFQRALVSIGLELDFNELAIDNWGLD